MSPTGLLLLAQSAADAAGFHQFEPDASLINRYEHRGSFTDSPGASPQSELLGRDVI